MPRRDAHLADGAIAIDAPQTVKIQTTGGNTLGSGTSSQI